MYKKIYLFFGLALAGLLFASQVKAVCPVCTIAVVAGVGLSRWLGVDDSITGLWIGGFIISLIIWTISWLDKKNIRFYGRKILTVVFYYLIVIWPLYYYNIAGHPLNKLWGYDKLIVGIFFGSLGLITGAFLNLYLKKRNGGKVYFPFQKVILPVGILLILSGVFLFNT